MGNVRKKKVKAVVSLVLELIPILELDDEFVDMPDDIKEAWNKVLNWFKGQVRKSKILEEAKK